MKYTIFTPTYNRASLLPSIYDSLVKQSNYDFEWLIIDDGSSDCTEEVVADFASISQFEIRYIKQSNGGKHVAFNRAIQEARGEWFVCVDSDDPLLPGAIEYMDVLSAKVKSDETLAGFVGICLSPEGKHLGNIPDEYLISDTIEIRDVYKFQCEPEIYKTSILKRYQFPVYAGEKFITEAILFDKITVHLKLLYTNKPLQVKEYLPGGLTANQLKIRINSPNGTLAYYKQRHKLSKKWLYRLKALINYSRFYIHAILSKSVLQDNFYKSALLAMPLGLVFCAVDKLKS